ncbi:MAG: 30s ribosomal protein S12 methylthiotransferase accessory protein YcaO [Epsilonproteobacteria bacterium]|nr:MAG: 30s ribosomal protein S12 methylthiotransferase accessory protein YcaO [Campylobacterota bacterium]
MTEKTFIKGKDLDLESTIATMHAKLDAFGIQVEEISWLNPVPYIHSVHIRDKACGLMFTNGKGAGQKSCLASALGEYFERLSCNYFFADFYLGEEVAKGEFVHYPNERWFKISGDEMPDELLTDALWNYYDPDKEIHPSQLFDTNAGVSERGICALPFVRVRDEKAIWFPVNIIGNLYVSNGMAAGNTIPEARVQALSEIFERYVKNKIIAEGICLPEIPQTVIDRYPHIKEAIEELIAHGYHLRVSDASLGGIYPVISVTLINPKNGSVFASFGAHPCFEVALERTVTELLQGRGLDQVDDFQPPSFNLEEVADHHNLEEHFINSSGLISYDFFKESPDYEFADWNHDTTTESEFEYLSNIIHDMGLDIYIADYEHLNVYACRMIVPGMSEIYPVDDLLWSNNNEGAYFREAILSLKNLSEDDWQSVLENLEEGEYQDMQRVVEFIGIAPDPDTVWANLKIGELKAMLSLALKDYDRVHEWTTWCLHIGQLDETRRRLYQCVHALLEIKMDDKREYTDYEKSLVLMYGEKHLQTCMDLLEGKQKFLGLHSPGLSLEGFHRHQKLLEGYAKVHEAKKDDWNRKGGV